MANNVIFALSKLEIGFIIAAAVLFVALFVAVGIILKNKKSPKSVSTAKKAEEVEVVDGVRYTTGDAIEENGEVNITHNQGDVVLSVGKTVKAVKDGEVLPGKYTVLSAAEGVDAFNLRVGGFVREYRHGDSVVLGDGDEICAVSHAVILR